jgi:heme/copper-type cytochrome/quinol oxidase subunit 4
MKAFSQTVVESFLLEKKGLYLVRQEYFQIREDEKRLGFIFYAITQIAIAYYLYVQAPLYNKDRWLWTILGLMFGPYTLSIFLILTNRKGLGWTLLIVMFLCLIAGILFLSLLVWAVFFSKG